MKETDVIRLGHMLDAAKEIIRQRLIQRRRAELATEVVESRNAYQRGEVYRGTVADLMEDLAE